MFTLSQKVLFKHCDPAGIVFYPRYFEMMNDATETFFDTVLGWPFETLLQTGGVPTVAVTTQFLAPSRHGDMLDLSVNCVKCGRTSMTLDHGATCGTQQRYTAQITLVNIDTAGRPTPWPTEVRARLNSNIEGETP